MPLRVVFGAPLTFTLANGNVASSDAAAAAGSAGAGAGDDVKGTGGSREVTDEELRKAHGEYVSALRRLFDDNKARFGYANRELIIL